MVWFLRIWGDRILSQSGLTNPEISWTQIFCCMILRLWLLLVITYFSILIYAVFVYFSFFSYCATLPPRWSLMWEGWVYSHYHSVLDWEKERGRARERERMCERENEPEWYRVREWDKMRQSEREWTSGSERECVRERMNQSDTAWESEKKLDRVRESEQVRVRETVIETDWMRQSKREWERQRNRENMSEQYLLLYVSHTLLLLQVPVEITLPVTMANVFPMP